MRKPDFHIRLRRKVRIAGALVAAVAVVGYAWVAYIGSPGLVEAASGVSGTVQKPDGTAVSEVVEVCFFGPTGGNCGNTAANGSYNINVNAGHYRAQAKPLVTSTFGPSQQVDVDVFPDQTTSLNLKLTNLQLKGRLTKPDGTGVRGSVDVHSQDFSQFAHSDADNDGYYKLGGLPAGIYVVEVRPPFDATGLTSPAPAEVTLGNTVVEKNFTFTTAAKKITGTVKKSDGTAAQGNMNAFRMNGGGFANAPIDSTGNYSLSVDGGLWNVQPFPQPGADWVYSEPPKSVDFANDTTSETKTVDFIVKTAAATIKGTLKDKNGKALQGCNIDARTPQGGGGNSPVGADGAWTIKTTAGTYNLFMWCQSNIYSLPQTTVNVNDNETQTLDLVATEKTARIKGKVTTSSGAAAGNIDVNAFQITESFGPGGPGGGGPGSFSNTRTLADGTYELAVTKGRWNVHLGFSPDAKFVAVNQKPLEIEVATDSTIVTATEYPDLNFVVTQTDGTIKGRVIDATSKQPVTNFFGCAFARAVGSFNEQCSPIQNGNFTINISTTVSTSWEVGVHTPPNSDYSGSAPQKVTVTANTSAQVDVELVKNNSSISGSVVSESGFPLSSCDFRGMVFADGVTGHYQGEIQKDCSYKISLVAGVYHLGSFFDPKAGFMNRPPSPGDDVIVSSGQSTEKNIVVFVGDATIGGTFLNPDGSPVQFGFAHADNLGEIQESRELKGVGGPPGAPPPGGPGGKGPEGADLGFGKKGPCGATDPAGVIKCCGDSKNEKACRAFSIPQGPNGCTNAWDCVQQCKTNPQICKEAEQGHEPQGPEIGKDFTGPGGCKTEEECKSFCTKPENFKTCSEFKPPAGALSVRASALGVRATAEGPSSSAGKGPGGPAGFDNAIRSGTEVRNGKFEMKVLSGHKYNVCAGLPPESGAMPPKCAVCDLTKSKTCTVSLQARAADATIEGKVTIAKNPAERCFVGAWAEDGGHSGSPCNPGGQYKLNVTKDTTWHVCGDSYDPSTGKFYRCKDEANVVVTDQKKVKLDIELAEGKFRIPEPVTKTFTCSQPTTVTLDNGTEISVPASAISTDDDGQCSLTVRPTINIGRTKTADPLGSGIELSASDENGAAVTDLKSNITIKFQIEEDALTDEGIEDTSAVLPAFFNSNTSSYDIKSDATAKEGACSDNASEDCVTITTTTDHLSAYTVVNASGSSKTLKSVTVSTSKNKTSFTVGSKKVTPFKCQTSSDTVTVKTNDLGGTQLIVTGATCDSAVKVYNTSGKVVKNLKAGKVASIALADVTGDGKKDIIAGLLGTPQVKVYNVASKYKGYTVVAGTGKTFATVGTALQLQGEGGPYALVTGVVASKGAAAGDLKAWKFSKNKFSTSTYAMSSYLKASTSGITLKVGSPSVKSVSPKTIATSSTAAKLTVKGKNFTPDTKVLICDVGTTTKFKSATQLNVTVDGTQLTAGKCSLTVTNLDGSSASTAKNITVN